MANNSSASPPTASSNTPLDNPPYGFSHPPPPPSQSQTQRDSYTNYGDQQHGHFGASPPPPPPSGFPEAFEALDVEGRNPFASLPLSQPLQSRQMEPRSRYPQPYAPPPPPSHEPYSSIQTLVYPSQRGQGQGHGQVQGQGQGGYNKPNRNYQGNNYSNRY